MQKPIPTYELYGSFLADGSTDPVHCESIEERSSKHDWTIRVHRHRRLAQIFLLKSSGVSLRLGEIDHVTQQPTILVIPPGVPHGFRFPDAIDGDVISARVDELPKPLQERLNLFSNETRAIFPRSETSGFAQAVTMIDELRAVYRSVAVHRVEIAMGILDLITLFLACDRQAGLANDPGTDSRPQHRVNLQTETFCALLEQNFQNPLTVEAYAKEVGISAPHLTRLCREVLGAPPNALVRQRRIIEAKRLLEYTALTVAEIAHRCGFRDAAFFSRAFKKSVGIPPNMFRNQLDG